MSLDQPSSNNSKAPNSDSLFEDFWKSAAHAAVEAPVTSIGQMFNDDFKWEPIKPGETRPGSLDCLVQGVGGAAGLIADFSVLKHGLGKFGRTGIAADMHLAPTLRNPLGLTAASGGLYGGLLTPTDPKYGNQIESRLKNAAILGTTFTAMEGLGGKLSTLGKPESKLGGAAHTIGVNAASGVPIGAFNTQLHSLMFDKKFASPQQTGQAALDWAVIGGALAAPGAVKRMASNEHDAAKSVDNNSAASEPADQSTRQFKVVKGQDRLDTFVNGQASDGVMLKVRENTDKGAGIKRNLWVQHDGANPASQASKADLIAVCNAEQLPAKLADKQVLPGIPGKIDMLSDADAAKVTFGKELSSHGNQRLVSLDEQPAKSNTETPVTPETTLESAETKTSPDEVAKRAAAMEQLEKDVADFSANKPTFPQMADFYKRLEEHPEFDEKVGEIYQRETKNDNVRRAIEGFYKPANDKNPEVSREDSKFFDLYEPLRGFIFGDYISTNSNLVRDAVASHVGNAKDNGVDLIPALEHLARTTRGENAVNIVKGIDEGLNKVDGGDRNYSSLLELRSDRPLPISDAVRKQQEVDNATLRDAEHGTVTRPDADAPPPSPKAIEEAAAAKKKAIEVQVEALSSSDPKAAALAAQQLAERGLPNNEGYFEAWREIAPNAVPFASVLNTEAVKALPDATVRDMISSDWSGVDLGQGIYRAAQPGEQLQAKFDALGKISEAFVDQPTTADMLLKAGKDDPASLISVAERVNGQNADAYKAWLGGELAKGTPLKELAGEGAVNKATLYSAFKDSPDVAQKLLDMSASNPEFDLNSLVRRIGHPKMGEQFKALVKEKVDNNATVKELGSEALWAEFQVKKQFSRTPEIADKLVQLGKDDPAALQELLQGPGADAPRPRGPQGPPDPNEKRLSFAYKDMLGEFVPQATSLAQLQAVANAVKAGKFETAFQAALPIRPLEDGAWTKAQSLMRGVAEQNVDRLPVQKRAPRDDNQRSGQDRYPRRKEEDEDSSVVYKPSPQPPEEPIPDPVKEPVEEPVREEPATEPGSEPEENTTEWIDPYSDEAQIPDGPYGLEGIVARTPAKANEGKSAPDVAKPNAAKSDVVAQLYDQQAGHEQDILNAILEGDKAKAKAAPAAAKPGATDKTRAEDTVMPVHGKERLGKRGGFEYYDENLKDWTSANPLANAVESGPATIDPVDAALAERAAERRARKAQEKWDKEQDKAFEREQRGR